MAMWIEHFNGLANLAYWLYSDIWPTPIKLAIFIFLLSGVFCWRFFVYSEGKLKGNFYYFFLLGGIIVPYFYGVLINETIFAPFLWLVATFKLAVNHWVISLIIVACIVLGFINKIKEDVKREEALKDAAREGGFSPSERRAFDKAQEIKNIKRHL